MDRRDSMSIAHSSIDFTSNIPYYIQLIELLKEKDQLGELEAG